MAVKMVDLKQGKKEMKKILKNKIAALMKAPQQIPVHDIMEPVPSSRQLLES
jgi:hypothetical protein